MQHNRNNAIQTRRTQESNTVHLKFPTEMHLIYFIIQVPLPWLLSAIKANLFWVPNSSQVRASKTVLQIIPKLMIRGYHQKICIMCYLHYLILSLLPFFLWVYFHRCSSQSALEMTYLWYSDHTADPAKRGKKKPPKTWTIWLNRFL